MNHVLIYCGTKRRRVDHGEHRTISLFPGKKFTVQEEHIRDILLEKYDCRNWGEITNPSPIKPKPYVLCVLLSEDTKVEDFNKNKDHYGLVFGKRESQIFDNFNPGLTPKVLKTLTPKVVRGRKKKATTPWLIDVFKKIPWNDWNNCSSRV